jgi:hypothetical protein
MRRILLLLLYLSMTGCAGFNFSGTKPETTALPQAPPQPPEGKPLAELVKSAFATAKLSGTPEISPVRPTHDSQWGDWVFCIKGNSADPSPKYAVLVGHDAVLEVRSSVLIDGCDGETYHPIALAKPPGKTAHKS